MRKKIAAANWKMNHKLADAKVFINELKQFLKTENRQIKAEMIVFPVFTQLFAFSKLTQDTSIKYGAQNLHQAESGAFTGEISANMIAETGASHVIIGHSERRQYFNEDNTLLAKKIIATLNAGLTPVFCCGETLEEREQNIHFQLIEEQLKIGLFHLNESQLSACIIAYEPVWAIGTGKTASPLQAQEIHSFIRTLIADNYSEHIADNISILYGGSIKPTNAAELFAQTDIDGGLIGGASLNAIDYFNIVKAF